MKRINNLKSNQNGVVSFFTVIFVSILLIAITTAFIRLMISGQRQATDNDLSTRAFYAAEAGIDDVLKIVASELDKDTPNLDFEEVFTTNRCNADTENPDLSTEFDTSYSCKFVSFDSSAAGGVTGKLNDGQSYNLDIPNPGNRVAAIRLRWHSLAQDGAVTGYASRGQNKPKSQWSQNGNNIPALIRFQAIQFPSSGIQSFAAAGSSNITTNVTFTYPTNSSSTVNNIGITSSVANGSCNVTSNNSGYRCFARYQGFNQENIFINLRAVNNQTNFQLTALDSSGNEISIGSRLVVDVTGRAGDVFRRIRVEVPISAEGEQAGGYGDANLNNVLLVDEELCKQLEATSTDVINKCVNL